MIHGRVFASLLCLASASAGVEAKTFQNSYVAFEVPDNWTCLQEGVAWTCTPQNTAEAREAVIVLAAKVAGPEDNLSNFLNYLKKPKKIVTRVGTPMPSQVMSAQERMLAGQKWIQAQHLGSEVQDYYTLYLATVKESLAILISFSTEKDKYKKYNPIFDNASRTLRIIASNQLLFPKNQPANSSDVIGIQVPRGNSQDDVAPPPLQKPARSGFIFYLILGILFLAVCGLAYIYLRQDNGNSGGKSSKRHSK